MGGQTGGGQAGSLRVTFPKEQFQQLAQETTLQAGFIFANETLSALAGRDFATEATLDRIAAATERTAAVPLVDALREVGITAVPNDPTDPTNAALTQSGLPELLGQQGLGLLNALQMVAHNNEGSIMHPGVDMSLMPGVGSAENPGFFNILNLPEKQEITGKVEITNPYLEVKGKVKAEIEGQVKAEITNELIRVAVADVVRTFVEGGQVNANFSEGELNALANALDIENVFRDYLGERFT